MTILSAPTEVQAEDLASLLDLEQTREVLESLSAVASVRLTLQDARGTPLLRVPADEVRAGWRPALGGLLGGADGSPHVLPIVDPISGEQFGRLRVAPVGTRRVDAMRLVRLITASIGQIAAHERDARQRMAELTTIYNTSMMLAEARDLRDVLKRTVRLVADVMGVKAASIRLIDEERDELRFVAVHGLSSAYMTGAPLRLSKAAIDQAAIQRGYEQVRDLRGDARVQFPDLLASEGIVSLLSVPMRYQGQAIGVLRAYTGEPRHFSMADVGLMRAVASQTAAAIVNARLAEESREAEALERQVLVAADVQQRMIPPHAPSRPELDVASAYLPCYDLAGDLFDFIELPGGRVGVVIADVAGKGVPASLIMATVRAYLRASAEHISEMPEMIQRLNGMLCRDNRPGEFVSLFYGVIDPAARTMDYILAGHLPPMLLRDGEVSVLAGSGDTVLGVIPDTGFTSRRLEMRPGDRLLLYTDGLDEARNFRDELYGKERVSQSFVQPAESAEMIVQNVVWDMRRFVGLQRRTDDVTVIAAVVK